MPCQRGEHRWKREDAGRHTQPQMDIPDWQERQEHSIDSEQTLTAGLDNAAATVIGDAQGDLRMINEVQSHPDWHS